MTQILNSPFDGFTHVICYSHSPDVGLLFDFSCDPESDVIKEFAEHKDVHSYELLYVKSNLEQYTSGDALRDLSKHMWSVLGDTPVEFDEDGSEVIDVAFYGFDKGTDVTEIWLWFESEFDCSVAKDLMGIA